jgi:hypothetical protein
MTNSIDPRNPVNPHLALAKSEADTGTRGLEYLQARLSQKPFVIRDNRRNLYLCKRCDGYNPRNQMSLPRDLYICQACK